MENSELLKSPAFLQTVICNIAEDQYDNELSEISDEIGPGLTWETKDAWMNSTISSWFDSAAKKIKSFPNKEDFNIQKTSIDIAKVLYEMKLGSCFDTDDLSSDSILRVPGGWIYKIDTAEGTKAVFVPYSDEFLTLSKLDGSNLLINKKD